MHYDFFQGLLNQNWQAFIPLGYLRTKQELKKLSQEAEN